MKLVKVRDLRPGSYVTGQVVLEIGKPDAKGWVLLTLKNRRTGEVTEKNCYHLDHEVVSD